MAQRSGVRYAGPLARVPTVRCRTGNRGYAVRSGGLASVLPGSGAWTRTPRAVVSHYASSTGRRLAPPPELLGSVQASWSGSSPWTEVVLRPRQHVGRAWRSILMSNVSQWHACPRCAATLELIRANGLGDGRHRCWVDSTHTALHRQGYAPVPEWLVKMTALPCGFALRRMCAGATEGR